MDSSRPADWSRVESTSVILLLDDESQQEVGGMLESCRLIAACYLRRAFMAFGDKVAEADRAKSAAEKCQLLVVTRSEGMARFVQNAQSRLPGLGVTVSEVTEETLTRGKNSLLARSTALIQGDTAILLDKQIDEKVAGELYGIISFRCHGRPGWKGESLFLGSGDRSGKRHVGVVSSVEAYLQGSLMANPDFDVEVASEGWFGGIKRKPRADEPYSLNDVLLSMKYWSKKQGWAVADLPFG